MHFHLYRKLHTVSGNLQFNLSSNFSCSQVLPGIVNNVSRNIFVYSKNHKSFMRFSWYMIDAVKKVDFNYIHNT